MINIENTKIVGFEPAIRGMRNPMNSWDKSDSIQCNIYCGGCAYHDDREKCKEMKENGFIIGPNDLDLMKRLAKAGPVDAKYRRMIVVYVDLTAPLYWWKEYDTYKVGTVANSCSTMHKIHAKEFTLDDFSHEQLADFRDIECHSPAELRVSSLDILKITIVALNYWRQKYLETCAEIKKLHFNELQEREKLAIRSKVYWWQMIQLLPSTYNQKRTIMFNYEVLCNIYHHRRRHKLDEWRELCEWIETLPYSEIITGTKQKEEN